MAGSESTADTVRCDARSQASSLHASPAEVQRPGLSTVAGRGKALRKACPHLSARHAGQQHAGGDVPRLERLLLVTWDEHGAASVEVLVSQSAIMGGGPIACNGAKSSKAALRAMYHCMRWD